MLEDCERWDGPFLSVTDVPAGGELRLAFPVRETETVELAADREFVVGWRGDDIVSITPGGTHAPLYDDREVHEEVSLIDVELRPGAELQW